MYGIKVIIIDFVVDIMWFVKSRIEEMVCFKDLIVINVFI